MRVIGVDPGSLKAGFGILESNPNGILHLSSGLLSLDPKKTMTERLTELFSDLESLIQKYKVDEMAIESIFFAKNAQSALKLGQARGAALIAAGRANLPIFEYPARSVKSAICGSGKADKQQIEHMIRILLKLPKSLSFVHQTTQMLLPFVLHMYKLGQRRAGEKMIAILTGKVLSKKPTQSIIDCGGVGYEIFHTPYTAEKIPQKEVRLFIHTHVREDALQLFGFYEEEEKEVFRELLKVSAVGPKLALSILSGIPFRELIQALQTKDIQRLQKIPGIGKKTAERLSVEMADRIAKNIHILSAPLSVTGLSSNKQQELESILINLGYQKAEVTRAVAKVSDGLENEAIEISLKKALGELTDIKQSARLN